MSFNGIRKPYVKVLERGRPYWAPRSVDVSTNKSKHRIRRVETEPTPLAVTLLIDGNSKDDLLNKAEEIAVWLNTEKEKPLIFDDRPNRAHWSILVDSVDVEEIVTFSRASLEFLSLYKTGETKEIDVTTTSQQHEVTGQVKTPWTIEVEFNENVNRFEFWAGDIYLQLNYQFIAGDRLTIHYTGREVWLRDRDLRTAVSMSSHFEELQPGTVSMRASHACTVKYTERYY